MKKNDKNKTSVLDNNEYEEIGHIPETIIESVTIDGEDKIEEDSIIEINYIEDFEELSDFNSRAIKSLTIIDELEEGIVYDKELNDSASINIEKLARQINHLTSIRKKKKAIKPKSQSLEAKVTIYEDDEEQELENKYEIEEKQNIIEPPIGKELPVKKQKKTIKIVKEQIPEEIVEDESIRSIEIREKEKKEKDINVDIIAQEQKIEKKEEPVSDIQESKETEEIVILKEEKTDVKEPVIEIEEREEAAQEETRKDKKIEIKQDPATVKSNFLSIEIPDNLLEKIPNSFNIDELGKIDLKEAEIIASEDILSLTKGKIIEGLEDLDIFQEKVNSKSISDEPVEEEVIAKEQEEKIEEKEIIEEKTEKLPLEQENQASKNIDLKEKEEKKEIINSENDTVHHESADKEMTQEPHEEADISDNVLEGFSLIDEIEINEEEISPSESSGEPKENSKPVKNIPPEETNYENVYIIDSESNNSQQMHNYSFKRDELEDLSSSIIDTTDGMSKQLVESEITDHKAITGLIRDNYPTFVDLLKETEEKPKYFTDDIDFVDTSFLTKNQMNIMPEEISNLEYIEQEKSTSYEMTTGLIPEEIELIENQLFDIDILNTGAGKSVKKIAGLDQHLDDTITLNNYNYILPFPESLNENEKKSIENDLSGKTALILEEDVEKIKKKLEDSMKKKIEETIQDITDKIIIYEENKKNNNDTMMDKENIRKLLMYLNELFDKLPEESIKNFADSDYYNLYQKVLKDMEI